ncbi:stAR-related lipid transfer protein 5-like [Pomacea canaliculata]|uniref:stAR-related lipid transfer protein 5-like n=1 Tax=Pomacea canaliculata TaxID=400727 RepID=UPI000D73D0EE|nr:stAR-related lipid transfer protein 5-like [Pomacea canaliculata]
MEGTDEYYRKTAEETAEMLKVYYNDNEGWELVKKTPKDIIIEYKHSTCPGFNGYLYRGQSEYNCPKETLFEYVDPLPEPSPRLRWDKAMKKIEVIRRIDENLRINHTATNSAAMGLISPRDFVDAVLKIKGEKIISTNGISIICPECPPKDKYVRGWNYHCGLMCIENSERPQQTKLMTFIQPDIRGMLPRSLVDSAIPGSMVDFFNNLRACLKADGKLID